MKSSFKQRSKKMKSLDSKHTQKLKNALHKKKITQSVIYKPNSKKNILREIENQNLKEQDEISLLSNANLNIIKILNSCANEDILNESSYIVSNSNEDIKDRSVESINKWHKRVCQYKASPMQHFKKKIKKQTNSLNSNISNFLLNSNISDFSSESIFSDKKSLHNLPKKSNFLPHKDIEKTGNIDEIPIKSNLKRPIVRYKSDVNNFKLKNKAKKPIVRHISEIKIKKGLRKASKKQLNYISDINNNALNNNEKNQIKIDSSDAVFRLNNINKKKNHLINFHLNIILKEKKMEVQNKGKGQDLLFLVIKTC